MINRKSSRALVLAALAAFVALSVPPAFSFAKSSLVTAWRLRAEDAEASCRRLYGETYWDGIEAIRRQIPPDGSYCLVWTGGGGTDVFARFDLAPRKALYVAGGERGPLEPFGPKDSPPWVVVVRATGRSPLLVAADHYFAGSSPSRGREEPQLPASLEEPSPGGMIANPLVVRGWCQELGGRPCESVRIFIDGEERAPDRLERVPRPDVESVVAGIGNCERAGFRAVFAFDGSEGVEHTLVVFFLTADGRWRRLGPQTFRVEPAPR